MSLRVVGGRRATLGVLGFAIAAFGTGCGGGGHGFPDASVFFDGHPDTTPAGTGGAGADAGTRPPPTPAAGALALFTGPSLLIGSGPDSCTNQDPASGDRWCGFAAPSSFAGGVDLWVINVSKAVAGKAIRCDSSDLDCLLLTSTLDTANGLNAHSFFGDTLIYSDGSGPIYGWRPGMTAGRKLTSNQANVCIGQSKSDAVLCAQNQDSTTVPTQTSIDIVAGKLSVGGTAMLPKVATLLLSDAADPSTVPHYQVGLSPTGDWVAWSTRPTAAGVETLSAQKLNDDSTRVVIAEDVSQWDFSADGTSWYWLKSYNYSASGNPLGTLQAAPFPPDPGGAPTTGTTIQTSVAAYFPGGNKGVFFFGPLAAANGSASLSVMEDRAQPAQVKLIDRNVIQLISLAHDGRTVVYAKTVVTNTDGSPGLFDLYAGGLDLAAPCTLTATATSPFPFASLSEPTADAFWGSFNATTGVVVGNYTDLATCRAQPFASDLFAWSSVSNQGIVFADSVIGTSLADADVTLRYAQFTGGALPATGTVIQTRANPTFAVTLPSLDAVVYGILAGVDADGIYVKSDLPFTPTP